MDYRIIEKEAFKVIGKVIKVSTRDEEHHERIVKLWDECNTNGTCERLCAVANNQNLLGICMDFEENTGQMSYMIAVESVNNLENTEFDIREIPAAHWAIFTSVGPMPSAILEVWARVFQEWFPSTNFNHANAPELEVYLPGDTSAKDYKCELWIPVVKND